MLHTRDIYDRYSPRLGSRARFSRRLHACRYPFRPFADFSSHDDWGCDHFGFLYAGDLAALCAELEAKGVEISVPLKTGVGGRRLCYVAAPDDVNIEIMER